MLDDVDVFLNEIIDLRCGQLEDHYIYIYIVYWISGPHENEQLGW